MVKTKVEVKTKVHIIYITKEWKNNNTKSNLLSNLLIDRNYYNKKCFEFTIISIVMHLLQTNKHASIPNN